VERTEGPTGGGAKLSNPKEGKAVEYGKERHGEGRARPGGEKKRPRHRLRKPPAH